MRRAPQEGQNPRRLQENATGFSCAQPAQRRRRKPWARRPHARKASNSSLTNPGRAVPVLAWTFSEEGLQMLPQQPMQERVLGPPPLVADRVGRRDAQQGFALQSHPGAIFLNALAVPPVDCSGLFLALAKPQCRATVVRAFASRRSAARLRQVVAAS